MPLNVPTFFKRLGSSVVFVAIMLTGLLWNEWSFLGLVCLINYLCLREYFRLMQKADKDNYWPDWMSSAIQAMGFLVIVFSFFRASHMVRMFSLAPAANIWLAVLLLFFVPLFMLRATLPERTAWKAGLQALFGLVYISAPMAMLVLLHVYTYLPLFIIVMIWTNDTMAYLVGSFIGRTPFSPISPKKTWEGVIGGTVLTMIVAVFAAPLFRLGGPLLPAFDDMRGYAWCGLVVSLAGPAGDLFKSKFKRLADVKDSGNLMPGHGGALDRFDSLLMVTPFIYASITAVLYWG